MARMTVLLVAFACLAPAAYGADPDVKKADAKDIDPGIDHRFANDDVAEVPQFRKHIVPLLGKLGCNGRACHGSFQGQGGFRLSLFGYDFEMDHEGLTGGEYSRVDLKDPDASLIIQKPTLSEYHEGGKRYELASWEHRVLREWIEGGAEGHDEKKAPEFVRLDVTPQEIVFAGKDETARLKVIAVWSDGSREDVTPLCRFQSNDEQVAAIDGKGLVTATDPGDTHVVVFYDNGVVPIPVIRPVSDKVGPKYPDVPTPTQIDGLVLNKLRKLGIVPSELASDAEFLRRVSLDMTGTLPTPQEIEQFLADSSPDKRARKIDELLERPTYAAWWTTRLCDWTGNNDDALINSTPVRGVQSREWYDWIYKRVAENVPYDELAAGIVLAVSRDKGESFEQYCETMSKLYQDEPEGDFASRDHLPYYWARRTFRQPDERAIGFAYTFLGIRIQCAQCHKHPFDQWTQDDFKQFTPFFEGVSRAPGPNPESRREYNAMLEELGVDDKRGNEQRRELERMVKKGTVIPFPEVYATRPRPAARGRAAVKAKLLGADVVNLSKYEDAREPLMDWLRSKDNPYFARAFVNRVWSNYFGIGIVEPVDDLSLANPPSNRELLDYLAQGFIDSGFDMKWLHREIANSRTYQLSWVPNETNRLDERNFSRAIPRRLPAEIALDTLRQATSSDERFAAMQHELDGRAIAIGGAGRRNRQAGYALEVFGRSIRESNCDCDRSTEASLLQTVYLRNDGEVMQMLTDRRSGWVGGIAKALGEQVEEDRGPKKPADYEKRVEMLRNQIRRMLRNGNEEGARKLRRQLVQLRTRFEKDEKDKPQASEVEPISTDEIIRQAYLRTVSRYPDEREVALARDFLKQSEQPADGVRDLLWALINTKEFIVNH